MNKSVIFIIVLFAIALAQTPKERAKQLLAKMTLQEKLLMLHGVRSDYVGMVSNISRLQIPALKMEDGPQGVADGVTKVTCFPSALTTVATWDRDLMYKFAEALTIEQKIKGTDVVLGPMINIARVPMGGRNFESFGEDPYLTSQMVVPYVKGVQDQGLIANVKHFVNNNQEEERLFVSANVQLRAQWEIYYPGFEAAVNAGVDSVMCAYNKINDTYACENEQTFKDLKEVMKFDGFVVSDWGATHSTIKAARAGLDMEMPGDEFFGRDLERAVAAGAVPRSRIDDMVLRILTPMFKAGIFDRKPSGDLSQDARSPERALLSRNIGAAAAVLLKNENNALPLSCINLKSIAVIGDDGHDNPLIAGGGSGNVNATLSAIVTPLKAIRAQCPQSQVSYANSSNIGIAVNAASKADVALVFVSAYSSEGIDRKSLQLDGNQNDLVSNVAKVNKNTIVVYHGVSASILPWVDQVSAIVYGLVPGQEIGNAITDVLFGHYNPSGRLPITFPVKEDEIPVNTKIQYPGINNQTDYSEGLLVGYRWYDAKNVNPLFPFGHGLSYTTFAYGNININTPSVNQVEISVQVKNTGTRDGAEVVQLYIEYPEIAGEPPKNLRGFEKVFLKVGESRTVTFTLNERDVSIFDVTLNNWKIAKGTFNALVGASSRDIRIQKSFII